jgi:hypothetical protein
MTLPTSQSRMRPNQAVGAWLALVIAALAGICRWVAVRAREPERTEDRL